MFTFPILSKYDYSWPAQAFNLKSILQESETRAPTTSAPVSTPSASTRGSAASSAARATSVKKLCVVAFNSESAVPLNLNKTEMWGPVEVQIVLHHLLASFQIASNHRRSPRRGK